MKKIISTLMVTFIVTCQLQAQIEVYSNNKVGIGTTGTVNSMLSVNHLGYSYWKGYIYNTADANSNGAFAASISQPTNASYWNIALQGSATAGLGSVVGVRASAYTSTPSTASSKAYGVYATAGNAYSGRNYAVYGLLQGTNNGAAIFGTLNSDVVLDNKYAGYFYGTTKVNGDFYCTTLTQTSDETAKKEVKQLDKNNMAKLKQLNGVSYKYKNPVEMGQYGAETTDTVADPNTLFDAALYEQVHLGLLAQELQAVYPELVKTDPSGLLGIDYMGLIPVLLEAIKEQQAAIDDQQTAIKILTDEVDKLKTKADR
ncbi:MAG: hypothetical protein A2W95_01085 [Bacteroidetes bacterium GWA2_40_14]|nr:MAG: hypothetical protein A2W95_01085 [Bacteroidetes bacterium GWA2_40_14]